MNSFLNSFLNRYYSPSRYAPHVNLPTTTLYNLVLSLVPGKLHAMYCAMYYNEAGLKYKHIGRSSFGLHEAVHKRYMLGRSEAVHPNSRSKIKVGVAPELRIHSELSLHSEPNIKKHNS
jgi:hypothetical protein